MVRCKCCNNLATIHETLFDSDEGRFVIVHFCCEEHEEMYKVSKALFIVKQEIKK
jgi:hypothetical protein